MSDAPNQQSPATEGRDDIIQRLAQAARVQQKEAGMPSETLTKGQADQLRQSINRWRRENAVNQRRLAEAIEVSRTTLSNLLSGTYKADPVKHLLAIRRIMDDGALTGKLIGPEESEMVRVTVIEEMEAIVERARSMGTCAVIFGPSGCGKTLYAQARAAEKSSCVYLNLDDDERYTRRRLILCFADALRIKETKRVDQMMAHICEALNGLRRVIFVDNAHLLSVSNLWTLHSIHDRSGAIIICIGQPKVYRTLKLSRNDDGVGATLWRRFGLKWDLTDATQAKIDPTDDGRSIAPKRKFLHKIEDVQMFLDSKKVRVHPAALDWLHRLVNRREEGGWGTLKNLLILAESAYPEAPHFTLRHVTAAYQAMAPEDEQRYLRDRMREDQAVAPAKAQATA